MADWIGGDELGYRRARTAFRSNEGLRLDESYRLAHLPLVEPDHPYVIPQIDGKDYAMGRHGALTSLVLPIDQAALERAPGFQVLDAALRQAPFASKIAWDLLPKRAPKLHATLCGSIATAEAGRLPQEVRRSLETLPPFRVALRGLFSGNVNLGRFYLRLYPERMAKKNPIHAVQAAFGRPPGYLYLAGLHNLTDHLDAPETAALADIIARHWDTALLDITVVELQVLTSRDDLVLDSEVTDVVRLAG